MPPSGKKSVDNDGVLGVLCHGDKGTRRFGFDAPGRERPAFSRCSVPVNEQIRGFGAQRSASPSVQANRLAMICNTWNFLGSALSRAKKCKKWLVTSCLDRSANTKRDVTSTYLSMVSSGLPFLRYLNAFVK